MVISVVLAGPFIFTSVIYSAKKHQIPKFAERNTQGTKMRRIFSIWIKVDFYLFLPKMAERSEAKKREAKFRVKKS